MAVFRGKFNIVHGGPENPIRSTRDDVTREYVVEVTGEDAKAFRRVADYYGYVEDKS